MCFQERVSEFDGLASLRPAERDTSLPKGREEPKEEARGVRDRATLVPMQRLFLGLLGMVGVTLLFFGMKALFSYSDDVPAASETGTSSSAALTSSFSSSLNLIVRVSTALKREKTLVALSSSVSRIQQLTSSGVPYVPYLSRSFLQGKPAVLFFIGVDDPFSARHAAFIQTLVVSSELKVPTYRLDFATATGARIDYGVVVPDTFILLDAKGQRIESLIHPTDEELKKLLTVSHS